MLFMLFYVLFKYCTEINFFPFHKIGVFSDSKCICNVISSYPTLYMALCQMLHIEEWEQWTTTETCDVVVPSRGCLMLSSCGCGPLKSWILAYLQRMIRYVSSSKFPGTNKKWETLADICSDLYRSVHIPSSSISSNFPLTAK